jgi:hypothetical protein
MARTTGQVRENGQLNLQAALAAMLQNQATFISHLDEDRQRFTRIERDLDLIKAMLLKHEEMLQKLAEAFATKSVSNPKALVSKL